ncbi:MAG TPA: zinc-ribbon domain-containing protein [Terriglobales bacterium]|nr:zinc-ribbon domain-containing protein [Terriglobales bacterium]
MYVRCTHCGYDNSPEYRFCGMCGAALARPAASEPPSSPKEQPRPTNGGNAAVENVHGPSFLGLAEDPKVEFHYLYEDEQPRSKVGLVFFLIIALGIGGYLAYQWKNGGFPFNRSYTASNSGGQTSASPSEVAPAPTQDQQTHIDKPMTGAGDVLPTQPDQNTQKQTPQTQAAGKPTETDIPPAAGSQPNQTSAAAGNSATPNPAAANPADGNASQPQAATAEKPAEKSAEPTQEAKSAPPAGVAEASRTAREPARAPKPTPSRTAQAATTSPDADLELTGERYLYGTGVAQNCARAQSSLQTAATRGNSKAQTVLGTMYATGHCVGRDLPTAYRWFARALHQEPQNGRISTDLQVLWRQMTPQEKQLAMAGQ